MDITTTTTVSSSRRRRIVAASVAAIFALGFTACGDDDDDDASSDTTAADNGGDGGSGAVAYEVTELSYSDVSAPAGGAIEITNSSGAPHTFTADDGEFDVEYGSDDTATVDVPADAGEYPFHCEIHSSMQATLTVE